MMAMADLDILTYGEKKAFRKGRREGRQEGREEGRQAERRLRARRMHGLGLDTETIANALGVSPDAVIGHLDDRP